MTITADELQPFCSKDPARLFLHKPWTRDGYTYATDGMVLVKVPALPNVEPNPQAPDCERVIASTLAQTEFVPLPSFKMPKIKIIDCNCCGARGVKHDCPDCQCTCIECDGAGKLEEVISITLFGAIYNISFIYRIMTLPGFKFSAHPPLMNAARFIFDGDGIGLIMPRRVPAERHIKPRKSA